MCLLVRKAVHVTVSEKGGHITSMTHAAVTIQVAPESTPSPPSWMGEVAAFAQVLSHVGLLKAIQEHVQFARARFGKSRHDGFRGRASGLCEKTEKRPFSPFMNVLLPSPPSSWRCLVA